MREPDPPLRQPPPKAVGEASTGGIYFDRLPRNLAIAALAGAFMAIVGAFGTLEAPLWRRLLYWIPTMLVGALVGGLVATATMRAPHARENVWLHGALITLGISIPSAAFLWVYTAWFFGFPICFGNLPWFFGTVLVVSAAMTAIMMAVNRPGAVTHAAAHDTPARARFLERLPPKLMGAALYAIEAEDHYLRLHTSKGQDLILLRLSDAIAELDGIEGAQTHRSWWVAKDAVQEVKRDNGRVTLLLPNGAAAPVSRPNVKALREAGWL